MNNRNRDLIVLTLTPSPPGEDALGRLPVYRLRTALKQLLRGYGLKCVALNWHTDERHEEDKAIDTESDATACNLLKEKEQNASLQICGEPRGE